MIKICNQCGQSYKGKPVSKFCSPKCFAANISKKVEKTCLFCGSSFLVKLEVLLKNKGIYCSKDCVDKHKKEPDRTFFVNVAELNKTLGNHRKRESFVRTNAAPSIINVDSATVRVLAVCVNSKNL